MLVGLYAWDDFTAYVLIDDVACSLLRRFHLLLFACLYIIPSPWV